MRNLSLFSTGFIPYRRGSNTFQTGLVPGGKTTAQTGVQDFSDHCDEMAKLGVRQVEFNNTRAQIAEAFVGRIAEFREEMSTRNLTMPGIAQFSHMDRASEEKPLLRQHLLIGEFMAKTGGKYITHMIAPSEVLNEVSDDEAYGGINLRTWAKNLNEVSKQVYENYGVKMAYHPEQREVSHRLYEQLLESTDERYVFFLADVGHLAAGGADPVQVCRKYRKRLLAVHLKDFSPNPDSRIALKQGNVAGNVAFGKGMVDLSAIVMQLQRANFTGWVMGEGGGNDQSMYDYMSKQLNLKF